jgi:hypothetical protein
MGHLDWLILSLNASDAAVVKEKPLPSWSINSGLGNKTLNSLRKQIRSQEGKEEIGKG